MIITVITALFLLVLFFTSYGLGNLMRDLKVPNKSIIILTFFCALSFNLILGYIIFSSGKIDSYQKQIKELSKISDQYYLPAEILAQNGDKVFFTTMQGVYVANKANLDPNTEYLLTMASNNTKNITDDDICVIWEVK